MVATISTVLLPGLHGTELLFQSFRLAAPAGFDVTVWPLPTCTFTSYRALAKRIADQLPSGEKVFLVAESFSGPLAVTIAAEHPAKIAGLVLVATFVDSPLPRGAGLIPWSVVFRLPLPAFAARLTFLGPDASVNEIRELRDAVRGVSAHLLASRLRLVQSVNVTRELAACDCPLLYIRPTADRLVPMRCLDRIVSLRKDTRVVAIDGPHLILQKEPAAAWRHIADFCRQIADGDKGSEGS